MLANNHLQEASDFESKVREFLSKKWSVGLRARSVKLSAVLEKKFDLVSEDCSYVGDAKYYKNIPVPAAKWSTIAEYVWMLEKVNAKNRFMVFGKDKEVAVRWIRKYGSIVNGIKFYFFDGTMLEELN
jgi:hypothetical protein